MTTHCSFCRERALYAARRGKQYACEAHKKVLSHDQLECLRISRDEWKRQGDNADMVVEVWKENGGIVQEMYVNGEKVMSTFSKRPYTLGQVCDGTVDVCVHALFIDYCRKNGLDPCELYQKAYPDTPTGYYGRAQQKEMRTEAELQGVAYPKKWDKKAFDGLIESLTEINNHSLVSVLLNQ